MGESTDTDVQAGILSQLYAPGSSNMDPSLYWALDNAKMLQLHHHLMSSCHDAQEHRMFLNLPVGLTGNLHTTLYKSP